FRCPEGFCKSSGFHAFAAERSTMNSAARYSIKMRVNLAAPSNFAVARPCFDPHTLSSGDARSLENHFLSRFGSLFHGTHLSSRSSQPRNYFWPDLYASVPRGDAYFRENPSPGV